MTTDSVADQAQIYTPGGFLFSKETGPGYVSIWTRCVGCGHETTPRRVSAVDAWREAAAERRALLAHSKAAHPSSKATKEKP